MMRGGLISMLYSKATDVQLTEVDTSSSLTLMSADIERIVTGMETGHEVRSPELRFERGLIQTPNKGMVECIRDCPGHVPS
jgi:hypothetical protein